MHYLLFYEGTPDYLERRAEFRRRHLEHAWRAQQRGELILAGGVGEPVDGAVLLFAGDSPEAAEEFARRDPYVTGGIVASWRVRPWITVVGELASTPVRPEEV
jgi:uncharacterized protein